MSECGKSIASCRYKLVWGINFHPMSTSSCGISESVERRGRQLVSIFGQVDSIRTDLLHLVEISGGDLDDISSEIRLEVLDRLPRVLIADKVDRDTLSSESTRST